MAYVGTIALDSRSTTGPSEARIEDLQTQSNSGHHGLCGSFVRDPPAKAEMWMVPPSNQPAPRYQRLSITTATMLPRSQTLARARLWLSRDRLCGLGHGEWQQRAVFKDISCRGGGCSVGAVSTPSANVATPRRTGSGIRVFQAGS